MDLQLRIQSFREKCLLGDYKDACELFEKLSEEIQAVAQKQKRPLERHQWQSVAKNLAVEYKLVKDIRKELSKFEYKPVMTKQKSKPVMGIGERCGRRKMAPARVRKQRQNLQKRKKKAAPDRRKKWVRDSEPSSSAPPPRRRMQRKPAVPRAPKRKQKEEPPEDDRYKPKTAQDAELCHQIEHNVLTSTPDTKWDQIAELEDAKRLLREAVVLPQLLPNYFTGLRSPWKGVLLFGPPGTGKTMLARAVAAECGAKFFNVSATSITSKYRGESSRLLHLVFEMARHYAPSVIFMDEVDAIASTRGSHGEHEASRRVKSELLIQMDGLNTKPEKTDDDEENKPRNVMVLAATNLPWGLDEALRRRFEKRIYIPLPNLIGREALFHLFLKDIKIAPNVDFKQLAHLTDGYSGADINACCRDASFMSLRKVINGLPPEEIKKLKQEDMEKPVTMEEFRQSFRNTKPSVGNQDLDKFQNWMDQFGST